MNTVNWHIHCNMMTMSSIPRETKQVTVLLVDDEDDFTSTLSKRLQRRGMAVLTAGDGFEAYVLMEKAHVDVVVMDLQMPGPDGLQTFKSIRQRFHGVEVILLTGHGTFRDEMTAVLAGIFDWLTKPVDLDVLIGTIKNAANNNP